MRPPPHPNFLMKAAFVIVCFLHAACLALMIWAQVLPWATHTISVVIAGTTYDVDYKNYQWVQCMYAANVDTKCASYESLVPDGEGWCLGSAYRGARASAILGSICFAVSTFFVLQKMCGCIERFKTGVFSFAHNILLVGGLVAAFSAFVLEVVMYSAKPDSCTGSTYKESGFSISFSPFVFLGAGVLSIAACIIEVKLKADENTAAASGVPAGWQEAQGPRSSVALGYAGTDIPPAAGSGTPAEQQYGRTAATPASADQVYKI